MKISLNNRPEIISDKEEMTLQELILYKNYSFHMLVTKVNDQLIRKEERDKTIIRDGDNVLVLHLISGG
ncbi:MAG: sulfur carrier protein ThiS [Bacteroidales bacterium]|nr:sulfur carrier protein ThiS [Bacteroidales bacterium]